MILKLEILGGKEIEKERVREREGSPVMVPLVPPVMVSPFMVERANPVAWRCYEYVTLPED